MAYFQQKGTFPSMSVTRLPNQSFGRHSDLVIRESISIPLPQCGIWWFAGTPVIASCESKSESVQYMDEKSGQTCEAKAYTTTLGEDVSRKIMAQKIAIMPIHGKLLSHAIPLLTQITTMKLPIRGVLHQDKNLGLNGLPDGTTIDCLTLEVTGPHLRISLNWGQDAQGTSIVLVRDRINPHMNVHMSTNVDSKDT